MALHYWLNAVLALFAVLAFVGGPLWLTLRHPDPAPDFAAARAYLRAKDAGDERGAEVAALPATGRRHHATAA